jgi:hypothetical protein
MSQNCSDEVTQDILYDCADKPKRGLDNGKGVLINWDDIDRSASIQAGALIPDLVLKAGKTGFSVEWFKDLASMNSAFAPNAEDVDGFLHNWLCRLPNSSTDNAERAKELANSRYILVAETRYKGVDQKSAFKVMGWDNGLKLSEMTWNTLENSGSVPYTAATEEGDVESYPYNTFLEGDDYAVSKATFDSLFASV